MEKETPWHKLKGFGLLLFAAITDFMDDKCLKKSASLAYYTVFSIGPLILILVWALGFLYGSQLEGPTGARDEIMGELNQLFGRDIANMLDAAIKRISFENKNSIGVYIGVGALMFSSTTIFVDIQNSINEIWRVKAKPKKGWLKIIIDRLISFSMILGLGFLLMTSLILSSIIGVLMKYAIEYLPDWDIQLVGMVNSGVSFVVIATLFGFIFAFLPDAKVRLRDIFWGAIFTTLLFLLGKSAISYYLTNNATASSYGAAGSVIILLAFVYYAAAILYFGAEFTKRYAMKYGKGIIPKSYAVLVQQTELEIDTNKNK
ncbi:YihY/virulence factor BrkB family protein [Sphingobacterium griseoflavum]|uniref:Uncharacterized protein n=1 Tax=Sphingobacterium griseoflavum TaxID=1474952 RepID=A0ABQ3HYH9_9SPHI|nr:YihY/virulence factor BrkB family protein [Sphingobacterium griseoflavum]GHE47540.1 hypothetical protein GCM10017764_33330 [Sphingobacterium griseoflavum]